ncbi:MAG: translesion error-prone DNA polymerase V autoproteolytic subunit [Spirochaetia bacterium]|nr:translesion error-prone DNA polymerase V autoproteolytic subunit [Spirochaetia bacterium]
MDNIRLQKISLLQEHAPETSPRIWLYNDLVKCGFPSPAEGYADSEIDFNAYLIDHPSSSYCFFVKGDSMEGLHILSGDLVVVDRSKSLQSGSVIVCCLDGRFTLKQFVRKGGDSFLVPANPAYHPLRLTAESSFEYWGTATRIVRKL